MNKSYILLRMYDVLCAGGGLRISQCREEYNISLSTFRRYMAFLRGYFSEIRAKEIVYRADTGEYILK